MMTIENMWNYKLPYNIVNTIAEELEKNLFSNKRIFLIFVLKKN